MKNIIVFLFLIIPVLCFSQYSVYFDGDDYAHEVVANWRSGDTEGTIAFWVNIADTTTEEIFFSTSDEGGTSYYWYVGILPVSGSAYFNVKTRSTTTHSVRGSTVIVPNTWYHLVIVSNGSAWSMYVNGSAETLTVTNSPNNGFWFGDVPNRDNIAFGCLKRSSVAANITGYIAQVGVFSSELSSSKITEYYCSGNKKDFTGESGLVGYWNFTTGSGTTLTDAVTGTVILDFAAATADPSWSINAPENCSLGGKGFKRFKMFKIFR